MSSTGDRYARAIVSTNLKQVEERTTDVDVLIAAGWVHDSLAATLYRLKVRFDQMDRVPAFFSTPACLATRDALHRYVEKTATRLHVKATEQRFHLITSAILLFLLDPTCPVCRGVRYQEIQDTHRLSDVACLACHATGKRKMFPDNACITQAEQRLIDRINGDLDRKMQRFAYLVATYLREE